MPQFNRAAKWFKRLLGRGANTDVRPELVSDGIYRDALNMRPASVGGNTGAMEAFLGEQLLYAAFDPAAQGYVLIGSASVNGRLICFWASPVVGELPSITINGVLVAQSEDIPYVFNRPMQIAVVERCGGAGVVYPADHQAPPLYWDLQDMLDSLDSGSLAYFEDYQPEANSSILSASPEYPRHVGSPITGEGLPAGQYSYSLDYVDPNGNVTNPGPETPLIDVARTQDYLWDGPVAGPRTTGGEKDLVTGTGNCIALEFNVDNTQGYSFVRVRRLAFNDGQGLNGPGTREIVAVIPVVPGEFANIQFVDPTDANFIEVVPPDEDVPQQININAPKSVEYTDNRLIYANFEIESRIPDISFTTQSGNAIVPITKKVTTIQGGVEKNSGYTDPVNNTYYKSFVRGEKYGLGIQPWDSSLSKPFVVPVPGATNYQMPNRRDPKTGDSNIWSDSPINAANTNTQSAEPVTPTFDAFTQGTRAKTNTTQVVNVIEAQGGSPYLPWSPIAPSDPSINGYNIPPVVGRVRNQAVLDPQIVANTGNVFYQQHNALGVLLYGVNDIPSWMKAFTVVRTNPAGRVVCQGIGTYYLQSDGSGSSVIGKSVSSVNFYSRDLLSGYVPQNVIEDMQSNPDNYEMQFVSPLGFYTEQYGYWFNLPTFPAEPNTRAFGTDQISYAGLQHDEGQVNAGEPPVGGMGYQVGPSSSSPPGNYMGYASWRNPQPTNNQAPVPSGPGDANYSFWHTGGPDPRDGNSPMTIQNFIPQFSGRSSYWRIDTGDFIYNPDGISTNSQTAFNDPSVRNFHQPWYVINIIKKGAEVPDLNTQQYVNTGVTIKTNACIGASNGAATQTYRLVNERPEDVLPVSPTDLRYVYVGGSGQPTVAWVCITNSTINVATVLADIAANGFWVSGDGTRVFGIYQVSQADGRYSVDFGLWGGTTVASPAAGSRIYVRYNPLAPVKVFGGDATISIDTHAIMDNSFIISDGTAIGDALNIGGLPLPYPGFLKNPNYILPGTSQTSQSPATVTKVSSLRQWCVQFDCESRTQGWMDLFVNDAPRQQSSLHGHYVIRPYSAGSDLSGFFAQWGVDYPGWQNDVDRGGIRFLTSEATFNRDYWKQPLISSLGLPQSGYTERTDYCNGIAASLRKDPLQDNTPGNRTFISSNLKVISEENGEIKVIASAIGPAGQNIYAWCQSGVCRVLTEKNILSGASGEQISTQQVNNFWGTELWLTRVIGSPDQMWRLFAKAYAPTGSGYSDSFFWADRNGFYRMTGDSISDISRNKYLSTLKPTLDSFPVDYTPQVSSLYNTKYNEVWFSIGPQEIKADPPLIPVAYMLPQRLFVYSALNNEWIGRASYDFEGYTMVGNQPMAMRNGEVYALDLGYTISGNTREASVTVPFVGEIGKLKDAFRFRVVGDKPDEIRLYGKDGTLLTIQNEALAEAGAPGFGDQWIRRYDSWEGYIWVVNQLAEQAGLNPEDELFFLQSIWNTEGAKEIVHSELSLRPIK